MGAAAWRGARLRALVGSDGAGSDRGLVGRDGCYGQPELRSAVRVAFVVVRALAQVMAVVRLRPFWG